ncbi:hypothetical protein AB4Y36_19475 [Paraburkholderia sp. BR10936]|uniref:hypothetical protein n=1 Tax=Paraburkholderia sp. BR10936 TaxID=3236993 RepID=UPI0034D2E590
MSSLSYREWDIFINERAKTSGGAITGRYQCVVPAFLMSRQTIGFLAEGFELRYPRPLRLERQIRPDIAEAGLPANGQDFVIDIWGQFDVGRSAREQIDDVLSYVGTLSVCTDFPLDVKAMQFVDQWGTAVFHASRRPIGRGVGFEIEERGAASGKINEDFEYFRGVLGAVGSKQKVAIRHYLTGMTLLALEDHTPGLIDAAYMQFYQAIEASTGDHRLEVVQKEIAKKPLKNSRDVQIICHQVFNVRHKYFGHGSETDFHEIADAGPEQAFRVAKQCLVARWLCRALIDCETSSRNILAREMRFYLGDHSDAFHGSIHELEGAFWADFGQGGDPKKKACKTYDAEGAAAEPYTFREAPQA